MELQKQGANSGSICKLEIVDIDKVNKDALTYNGIVIDEVSLAFNEEWEEIYFTEDSAHLVERHNGEHYDLKLTWRSPKDSADSISYLESMKRKRFIARITDLNGTVKIAGTKEEPCAIKHVMRDHGQNARDSNHYNLELSLSRSEPAAIITA